VFAHEGGDSAAGLTTGRFHRRVKAFYGNFSRAGAPRTRNILSWAAKGLKKPAKTAVLNANYVQHFLKGAYGIAHDRICMHECVSTPAS
jgi:glycine dehydrogenase subunit 2